MATCLEDIIDALDAIAAKLPEPVIGGFQVKLSANQNIPHNALTTVGFDDVIWNSLNDFDTANFLHQPVNAGKWLYQVQIRFDTIVAGQYFQVQLSKNGAPSAILRFFPSGSPTISVVALERIVQMNGSGDYMQVQVTQTSGGSQVVNSASTWTWLTGHYLGNY